MVKVQRSKSPHCFIALNSCVGKYIRRYRAVIISIDICRRPVVLIKAFQRGGSLVAHAGAVKTHVGGV